MELASYNHSYGQNAKHLVFVPKYTHKIFTNKQVKLACEVFMHEASKRYGFKVHILKVEYDPVHLFAELHPTIGPSKAAQLIKGYTSRLLFLEFPWLRNRLFRKGAFWSAGLFFRSVGNVTAETIEHYIEHAQGNISQISNNYI
ncbi:IS200/IS605 family transposase [archaeon AH-315-M20]|nr:IS200/IS605 family transposase [archaeon AH-315-M20]